MQATTERTTQTTSPNGQLQLVTVTPELAAAWLGKVHPNRHVAPGRVEFLVGALKGGEWRVNGETIKFDEDELLIDGQHRLQAVIASGMSMETYVMTGLPRGSFDTLDIGKPRTPSDTLAGLGYAQSTALAAAMRQMRVLDYLRVSGFYTTGQAHGAAYRAIVLTPALARSLITTHSNLPDWVSVACRIRKAGILGGDGFWAGVLYWFHSCLPDAEDDVTAFADRLISGAYLESTDPILVLRNRLLAMKEPLRVHHLQGEEVMAFTIKAWNAFRRGESIVMLKWSRGGAKKEKFPQPV